MDMMARLRVVLSPAKDPRNPKTTVTKSKDVASFSPMTPGERRILNDLLALVNAAGANARCFGTG